MNEDPAVISQEVRDAILYRDSYLQGYERLKNLIMGPGVIGQAEDAPENYAFEYQALVMPLVAFQTPKIKVSTRLPAYQEEIARYLELGLNRLAYDSKDRVRIVKMVRDSSMRWGVTIVVPEPEKGHIGANVPYRPVSRRLALERYFHDPLPDEPEDVRFRGHVYITTKKALLERAERNPNEGWHKAQIEKLEPGAGVSREGSVERERASRRDEIGVCEVWIPENGKRGEYGINGQWYTLVAPGEKSDQPGADFLCDPRDFYGPMSGPYVIYGNYTMGGHLYPFGALAAVEKQGTDLNKASAAMQRSAEKYKRPVIVGGTDASLVELMKTSEHDFVYGSTIFESKNIATPEIGGITDQMIAWRGIKREILDRGLGTSDVQRGIVTGQGTATENALASSSSNARLDFIKQGLYDSEQQHQTIRAWYLYNDTRVHFLADGGQVVQGGNYDTKESRKALIDAIKVRYPDFDEDTIPPAQEAARFEDLQIEIEPYSMERTSEAQQAAQAKVLMDLMTNVGPLIPQLTEMGVDVTRVLDKIGSSINMPDLGAVLSVETAKQVAERSRQEAAAQNGPGRAEQPAPQSSTPQPRAPTAPPPSTRNAGKPKPSTLGSYANNGAKAVA